MKNGRRRFEECIQTVLYTCDRWESTLWIRYRFPDTYVLLRTVLENVGAGFVSVVLGQSLTIPAVQISR